MNKTKKIVVGLSMILLAGTISGCGNPIGFEIQLPEIIPLSRLTDKYSSTNKIEIDFWSGFGATMSTETQKQVTEFEAEYPYIKVNYETRNSYEGIHAAITKSLASSSYPNVAMGYPDHFANYLVSNIQYVLDGFIESKEYGIDMNDYYENYLKENRSMVFEDGNKNKPYTVGLPFNKSTEVMVVNKDFFEAFDLAIPATWDEVNTTGAAIIGLLDSGDRWNKISDVTYTKDGVEKTYSLDLSGVTKNDFYPVSYDSQANFFITMAYQFGGQYTEMGDSVEEGKIKFDNPQVLEALTYIKKMNTDHILGIPSVWDETSYCSVPFKAMKSVMTISSSAGVANNVPTAGKFNVTIAPVPYKSADKKYVISQGTNLAILKDKNPEKVLASWLLVRYLSGGVYTEENNANVEFAISTGYLPVTKSGEQSTRYQNYINSVGTSTDQAKIAVQKIANSHYVNENWIKFVDPAFVGSADIRKVVENIIPFMITGGGAKIMTPQEAINYAYGQLPSYK